MQNPSIGAISRKSEQVRKARLQNPAYRPAHSFICTLSSLDAWRTEELVAKLSCNDRAKGARIRNGQARYLPSAP